jgi:hypothetical protein
MLGVSSSTVLQFITSTPPPTKLTQNVTAIF